MTDRYRAQYFNRAAFAAPTWTTAAAAATAKKVTEPIYNLRTSEAANFDELQTRICVCSCVFVRALFLSFASNQSHSVLTTVLCESVRACEWLAELYEGTAAPAEEIVHISKWHSIVLIIVVIVIIHHAHANAYVAVRSR